MNNEIILRINDEDLNRLYSVAQRLEEILFSMERLLLEGAVRTDEPKKEEPNATLLPTTTMVPHPEGYAEDAPHVQAYEEVDARP